MIIYELLALKLPYHEIKKTWDIADAVMSGVLPNLPPLDASFDPLIELFSKCLAMQPNCRPKASRLVSSLRLFNDKYLLENKQL